MKQTIEIRAVELVRHIRDDQAKRLAGKSVTEVMEFFNRAAERSRRRSGRLRGVRRSPQAFNEALQPPRQRRARG